MKIKDIKLEEIVFTEEEIILFLERKNFKIEIHKAWSGKLVGAGDFYSDKKYAIPFDEVFDVNKHKTLDITFKDILINNYKNFILNS